VVDNEGMMVLDKKYVYDGREWSKNEITTILPNQQKRPLPTRAVTTLQMVEGDYVLDVGCGIGYFASVIAKKAKKVVAVDILESSIEIAQDIYGSDNIDFLAGDLFTLNFPEKSFDCILFLETLEHVDNPGKYLQEFHRLLKPNGHMILSTPNAHSYVNILESLLFFNQKYAKKRALSINNEQHNTGTQNDHIYNWDFTTLYRLLNRNGFIYIDHAFAGYWPVTVPFKWLTLRFPFWTKNESWLMSLFPPFRQTLVFKVRKRE
jgi:ubiquinone/menaquinone biosynthesis C-methylase UbiE